MTPTPTPTPAYEPESEPFLLAHIAAILGWLEDLAAMLSGPLLTLGLLLAIIDLLTDGKLFLTQPELLYGWAIAMGVGLDAQLIGASAKMGRAWRTGRYAVAIGYLLLVAALAYVCFIAAWVFAVQQAYGITTAAALSRLGLDSTSWLWQRTAFSVFLVVLSGVLRVIRRQRTTDVGAELTDIAAKQQIGLARIEQWRAYHDALRGRSPVVLPDPPTDGGTPVAAADSGNDSADPALDEPLPTGTESAAPQPAIRLVTPPRNRSRRLPAKRRTVTDTQLRTMAFALLDSGQVTTQAELRAALSPIRQERANGFYHAWRLERGQQGQPPLRKRAR